MSGKIVQNSNSDSNSSLGLLKKADNSTLSFINSNFENLSYFPKNPNAITTSINSTSELISSSAESSNEFVSRETLDLKLEQPCNLFGKG